MSTDIVPILKVLSVDTTVKEIQSVGRTVANSFASNPIELAFEVSEEELVDIAMFDFDE